MVDLRLGDCLDILPTLPAQSVDAVICDPPYGTTACKWDSVIPFAPMWDALRRLIKPRGAIVLFGSQPFTSALVMSNPGWFKYQWVWDKVAPSDPLNVKRRPMRQHEDVLVFGDGDTTYHAQMRERVTVPFGRQSPRNTTVYGKSNDRFNTGVGYPLSIIRFPRPNNLSDGGHHPTQKPVALMEYLVRTYTDEGDVVLDFTMGSGTTGVACVNTGRRFIGIERDAGYYAIAERRIAEAQQQTRMAV